MTFFDFGEIIDNNTIFVIFGIPWDYLTSIELPNSAIAPEEIRKSTIILALTTELGDYIPELDAVDLGDIDIVETDINLNIKSIEEFIAKMYEIKNDIIPIMIGGDHFCSFPVIKAVEEQFQSKQNFGILIFDSHLDFYEEWDKGIFSHATITHRVFDLENINKNNLLIVGTRDIDIPELENVQNAGLTHINAYLLGDIGLDKYIEKIIQFFRKSNITYLYVSIDIDALDPSIAPGTGFAIPGGFTYREMWIILRKIAENFQVIGFDLVEVAPNLDLDNNLTLNVAAKLIVEFMSFINRNMK